TNLNDKPGAAPTSIRERLAEHRKNPSCSSCHAVIDPLVFTLENFDVIGGWRTVDEAGRKVDAAGTTVSGAKVDGLTGLRTVLRGMGAALALPFLDAMLPASTRRAMAAAKPAARFQTFYVPNGMAMEYWLPKGTGSAFELSPILEPLAEYRNQMLVLSGIKANWNYIHAGASGSFLTGTVRGGRNEIEIVADVSID